MHSEHGLSALQYHVRMLQYTLNLSNPLTPEYALRYSEHTLNVLKYAQSYFFLSVAEDIRSMLQCAQYVV